MAVSLTTSKTIQSIDLQEALEIVALVRKAKLINIKLEESHWANQDGKDWQILVSQIVQEALTSCRQNY